VSLTVHPRALNHHSVYKNVYAAASQAIAAAFRR
jgi:formaldehyde-activating enzyme involved in methanogenesis